MISLETIAKTLEQFLNNSLPNLERPNSLMGLQFKVQAQGVFLDTITDMKTGKNVIPVYVGSLGGQINAVPSLEEVDYNIPIAVYFPISLKESMFDLQELLFSLFVGQVRQYQEYYALSNISVPQLGEIQYFDVKQFQQWVNDTYKMPIEINCAWMSLTFNLYLSTVKGLNKENGYLFGNSWKTSLKVLNGEETLLNDTDPTFIELDDTMNVEPSAEQLLGTNFTKGIGSSSSYSRSISVYIKSGIYNDIVQAFVSRDIQTLILEMTDTCEELEIEDTKSYYIVNMTINKVKGNLMTLTLALGDVVD